MGFFIVCVQHKKKECWLLFIPFIYSIQNICFFFLLLYPPRSSSSHEQHALLPLQGPPEVVGDVYRFVVFIFVRLGSALARLGLDLSGG